MTNLLTNPHTKLALTLLAGEERKKNERIRKSNKTSNIQRRESNVFANLVKVSNIQCYLESLK